MRSSASGSSAGPSVSEPAAVLSAGRALAGRGGPRPALTRLVTRALHVVGSFGLAVTLLLSLLLLTALGTFAQADTSLFDVQKRYFESFLVVEDVGPLSIPLPGAATCLSLLAVNLVVGGLIRLRKGWRTAGILVTHVGILLLLAGSLVEALASDKGQLTLATGASGDAFQSYYEWELVLRERKPDGGATEWLVPDARLHALEGGSTLRVKAPGLPFEARLSEWVRNARPQAVGGGGVGGFSPQVIDPDPQEAGANLPAVTLRIGTGGVGQPTQQALLWGGSRREHPWTFEVAGRRFEAALRRRSWTLPFRIQLDRFEKEDHPGVDMPKRYSSFVTKLEDGAAQKAHVTMNEPLRHRGYTFYQSGFGRTEDGQGWTSTFAVVRNPADRAPVWSWAVIALGLLWHYVSRLVAHLEAEAARRRAAAKEAA